MAHRTAWFGLSGCPVRRRGPVAARCIPVPSWPRGKYQLFVSFAFPLFSFLDSSQPRNARVLGFGLQFAMFRRTGCQRYVKKLSRDGNEGKKGVIGPDRPLYHRVHWVASVGIGFRTVGRQSTLMQNALTV